MIIVVRIFCFVALSFVLISCSVPRVSAKLDNEESMRKLYDETLKLEVGMNFDDVLGLIGSPAFGTADGDSILWFYFMHGTEVSYVKKNSSADFELHLLLGQKRSSSVISKPSNSSLNVTSNAGTLPKKKHYGLFSSVSNLRTMKKKSDLLLVLFFDSSSKKLKSFEFSKDGM